MFVLLHSEGFQSIQNKIGLFCSSYDGVILSSGTRLTIVMTTNGDTYKGIGFLATVNAGT